MRQAMDMPLRERRIFQIFRCVRAGAREAAAVITGQCGEDSSDRIELAGGGGFEPPLPGPEPGVLPLDDPPPKPPRATFTIPQPAPRIDLRASADRRLETAAGAEARDPRGRDGDLAARARVAAVASRALRDHERAEAADGDATALAE